MITGQKGSRGLLRLMFGVAAVAAVSGFAVDSRGDSGWLPDITDGSPGQVCPFNDERVTIVRLGGKYSDNISQYCQLLPAGLAYTSFAWGTHWISEEQAAYECKSDGRWAAITGMACRGDYCDDVLTECGALPANRRLDYCSWTYWFRDGGIAFWTGLAIHDDTPGTKSARAVQCSGDYCHEMRFLICHES